jgi:hypothetical protein
MPRASARCSAPLGVAGSRENDDDDGGGAEADEGGVVMDVVKILRRAEQGVRCSCSIRSRILGMARV